MENSGIEISQCASSITTPMGKSASVVWGRGRVGQCLSSGAGSFM